MNYKLFKNISLLLISLTNLELQNQSHYFPNGPRTHGSAIKEGENSKDDSLVDTPSSGQRSDREAKGKGSEL